MVHWRLLPDITWGFVGDPSQPQQLGHWRGVTCRTGLLKDGRWSAYLPRKIVKNSRKTSAANARFCVISASGSVKLTSRRSQLSLPKGGSSSARQAPGRQPSWSVTPKGAKFAPRLPKNGTRRTQIFLVGTLIVMICLGVSGFLWGWSCGAGLGHGS